MSCNIVNEYVSFSKKCIEKYIRTIMDKQFDEDIFDDLIKVYIDVRYNNLYKPVHKMFEVSICYYLRNATIEIMKETKDPKKAENMFLLFKYILYFDNVRECKSVKPFIDEIDGFRKEKLDIEDNDFKNTFFEMLRDDLNRKKEFIEAFDCKDFVVESTKTNRTRVYNTTMEHKIKFPKIYSSYAIDKVFNNKEIGEQKLFVIYPIVTTKVLIDILKGNFTKTYLVDYNIELCSKPKKMKRLFNIINNDCVKEKIAIKLKYSDFKEHKDEFYDYMRDGFGFAIIIDNSFIMNTKNIELLKVFKYIIIEKNSKYYEEFKGIDNTVIIK